MIMQRMFESARLRRCIFVIALVLSSCSPTQRGDVAGTSTTGPDVGSRAGSAAPVISLPSKTFAETEDGSIRLAGHWVLRMSEPSQQPNDLLFAAQELNSTVVHCSALTRTCHEYRVQVVRAGEWTLFPLEPMTFAAISWNPERVVATWTAPANVECFLRIDRLSKEVEMEYRRQPSPGRSRVFERWVLE